MKTRQIRCFFVTAIFGSSLIGTSQSIAGESDPDWIAGHWCAEQGGHIIEESWLPPYKGTTIGMGRTMSLEATLSFEYLRIVDIGGVQSYLAQPGGRSPTTFKRVAGGKSWIRFENPDHDFPQRIEYRREGSELHAVVSGPGEDSTELVIRIEYSLCE